MLTYSNGEQIEILLATYNGEVFLPEMLQSLEQQTCADWTLLVSDDGSEDETLEVLKCWQKRLGCRMRILPSIAQRSLGSLGNFYRLLKEAKAPRIMFADQDDIWLDNKISVTCQAMDDAEQRHGTGTPILVHTDLTPVNAKKEVIETSYWRYQGLHPHKQKTLSRISVENVVSGCTMMINQALRNVITDIPFEARYHDWWIAMVAAAFGEIITIDRSEILWRRHGVNDSTVTSIFYNLIDGCTHPWQLRKRLYTVLRQCKPRAKAFLRVYGDRLTAKDRHALEALIILESVGILSRRWLVIKNGLFFSSMLRNVGMLLLM